jgi:hypothetical protein
MVFDSKDRNTSSLFRSIYNYAMGVLWLGVGIFFLFHEKWGYEFFDNDKERLLGNIFGVSAVLYGLFRVYRGFKKQ